MNDFHKLSLQLKIRSTIQKFEEQQVQFSPDKNIGPAALKKKFDLKDKILVHSIFHTYQGEMPFAGEPAVFLRLGGCNRGEKNISCKFCDTAFEMHDSRLMSIEEVKTEILAKKKKGTELVVITGGEPLIQQEGLSQLFKVLPLPYQIETNGDFDIKPENLRAFQEADLDIVCSPKAWDKSKTPFKSLNINYDYLTCYRFLISETEKCYQQVPDAVLNSLDNHAVNKYYRIPLYLSPMTVYYPDSTKEERNIGWAGTAIDREATIKNYQHAIKVADDLVNKGYRVKLSCQSHLMFAIP